MYDINEMKTPFFPRMIDYDSDIEAYCRLASRCISNADRLYVYIIANILQVYTLFNLCIQCSYHQTYISFIYIYANTHISYDIIYL